MIGLTPDQGAFLIKAAWITFEVLASAVALWLYVRRYAIRSFILNVRRHL